MTGKLYLFAQITQIYWISLNSRHFHLNPSKQLKNCSLFKVSYWSLLAFTGKWWETLALFESLIRYAHHLTWDQLLKIPRGWHPAFSLLRHFKLLCELHVECKKNDKLFSFLATADWLLNVTTTTFIVEVYLYSGFFSMTGLGFGKQVSLAGCPNGFQSLRWAQIFLDLPRSSLVIVYVKYQCAGRWYKLAKHISFLLRYQLSFEMLF